MTLEEKLTHFQQVALQTASERSETMLSDYRTALEEQLFAHTEQQKAQQALEIQTELESIRREGNQTLAQEHLQLKRRLSQKHSELVEQLFAEVHEMIAAYKQTPAYDELLTRRILSAKKLANPDEVIIYLDPVDADKKAALEEATHSFLTISQYSFDGGIRAVVPARNMLIDESFESRLSELHENFKLIGGNFHGNN